MEDSDAAFRVAIVGSGPAGFYAAAALLDADAPVEVDMIERLPTPWGLVRLGVAPDHPKLKSVSRAFERIAEKPGFRFFGNVEVGRDLSHQELEFDLNVDRALVIGNGNVALDVARMLALTPEELAPTDTTDPAIDAIGASTLREIVIVGRRGPAQASWTTQELKEMGELAGADVSVDAADLDGAAAGDTNTERNLDV